MTAHSKRQTRCARWFYIEALETQLKTCIELHRNRFILFLKWFVFLRNFFKIIFILFAIKRFLYFLEKVVKIQDLFKDQILKMFEIFFRFIFFIITSFCPFSLLLNMKSALFKFLFFHFFCCILLSNPHFFLWKRFSMYLYIWNVFSLNCFKM